MKWRILASQHWAEVRAIDPAGSIKWHFTMELVHLTPDDVYSTPIIGTDGLTYFGAETDSIYALIPTTP
ncbi:MAG TPA: hypothetical protein ENF45_05370 [Bacteroidetes bacterium]|nr:hypothetical protein [Bacteroidota bacterium]